MIASSFQPASIHFSGSPDISQLIKLGTSFKYPHQHPNSPGGSHQQHNTTNSPHFNNPVTVLINDFSASST
jgi:C-terminal processing protease CtpA/Prc